MTGFSNLATLSGVLTQRLIEKFSARLSAMLGVLRGLSEAARWAAIRMILASPGILLASPCHAQIVNTEPLFLGPEKRLGATAEGSLERESGNTDALNLALMLAGRYREGRHEGLLNGSHERKFASQEAISNRSFAHLRYRYYWTDRLQGEMYGQVAQDLFRLIRLRTVAGIGPRVVVLSVGPLNWSMATSYMYEMERVEGSVDFPDGLVRKNHRWNVMSSARVEFSKVTLRQTFYLQPAFKDFTNVRVLNIIDCAVRMSEILALKWSLEQGLDSIAPSDVRPFDNRFKASLKIDF